MPWRPLPQIAFAICTYPFQPSSQADLPLQIGDELYIIEQGGSNGDWYRGYLVAPPSLLAGLTSSKGQPLEARVFSGIFPRVCVDVREILGEAPSNDSEPQGEESTEEDDLHQDENGDVADPDHWPVPPNLITAEGKKIAIPKSGLNGAQNLGSIFKDGIAQAGASEALLADHHTTAKPPAPVPMLKIGDETPMSKNEPLVDEIASCLREWHSTNLHELLLNRRYDLLDEMAALVGRLDNARRQLLHKILTTQELQKVREQAVWDLVRGNRSLNGEVIVRSPLAKGRILNAEDSPIEITQLQAIMSLLDKTPESPLETKPLYHLLVDCKALYTEKTEGVIFSMQLASKTPGEPIRSLSEAFSIDPASLDLSKVAESEAKLKTLFADLSSADVGDVANRTAELYLIIRVYSNEPCRAVSLTTPEPNSRDSNNFARPNLNATWRSANFKAGREPGRLSLMWGQKSGSKQLQQRPMTGNSVNTAPRMGTHTLATRKGKPVKRTTGIGVVELGTLMRGLQEFDTDVTIWDTPSSPDESGEAVDGQNEIARELLPDASADSRLKPSSDRVRLHLKPFTHYDSEVLMKETPTLLQNVYPSRKIGFSGAPTKPRSDIYLTIRAPNVPWNTLLAHPKLGSMPIPDDLETANLQLTLEVRKASGERIEHCVFPSSNSAGHTAWRTTAVEAGQNWNQTIRLAVAPEDVPGCHIVMSIANAPNFPFALCWMPLWSQEAFVRDGSHTLALYKYDEYTSSMIAGKGAYLSLPWDLSETDNSVNGSMAAVELDTFLCSTVHSQDPDLLGILQWREKDSEQLTTLLKRFKFVPEIEIVKLLDDVFDALFDILVDKSGDEALEDLVFNALVIVLSILHDRRFDLAPLVDDYADNKFKYPFATAALIRSFSRLLSKPEDPENARRLRATSKVGGHVLRFTITALLQLKAKEAGIGLKNPSTSVSNDLESIFMALNILMRNDSPTVLGTKTIIVQNFHTWLPELYVMSPDEVFSIASTFIESCVNTKGRLALYRLILLNNFSTARFLRTAKSRATWKAHTGKWLAPYWGRSDSKMTAQWRDQIRLCCSVVATEIEEGISDGSEHFIKLVQSYRALQEIPRATSDSLSLLFPISYPFITKPTMIKDKFDEGLVEISALLASVAGSSGTLKIDLPQAELATFALDALKVFNSILDCKAFPRTWLSTHIYQHKSILKLLEKLMTVLSTSFLPKPDDAEDFDTDLWHAYLDTLIKLVGSDALALETFPEQKRRAAWKIAGDVRETGADLLRRSWQYLGWDTSVEDRDKFGLKKLGGYQVQYVPSLVGPVLELCLSVHDTLRHVSVMILQNMIISEWILSADLSLIQAEMIQCLDKLFTTKFLNEGMLQKGFITELTRSFEFSEQAQHDRDDPFFLAVGDLLGTIDELLDLLLAVHSPEASGEALQIMDTLHLMNFLRDVQKEDIYIAYVYRLAQVQAKAGNATEAGLALKMHADLYDWDAQSPVEALEDPPYPVQTAFERKEQIFFRMIKSFEDGQAWHQALEAYRELAAQYEHNTFDFAKLARTQRSMATIQDKISKGERQNPRYYRVIFRGLGFSNTLRDRQFIFEGLATDRLSSFADRLQQQYPSARISSGGAVDDIEGQHLSIYSVTPQRNLLHPVNRRTKVSQAVKDHFNYSKPNQFTTTSRRETSNVGVKEQFVEKILFTTAETFPTILRRSEIISSETVTLSPAQIGLERTLRKTMELRALEYRATEGSEAAFTALTEGLGILVNPKSNGCVAEYWNLIPQDETGGAPAKTTSPAVKLYEEALRVAMIDHAFTIKHSLELYNTQDRAGKKAQLTKNFVAHFGPVLAIINELSNNATPNSVGVMAGSRRGTETANPSQGGRLGHIRAKSSQYTRVSEHDNATHPVSSRSRGASAINRVFPTPSQISSQPMPKNSAVVRPVLGNESVNGRTMPHPLVHSQLQLQPLPQPQPQAQQEIIPRLHSKPKPSYSQNLQTKVGSVTKRWSTLNVPKGLRRKASKNAELSANGNRTAEE